MNTVKPLAQLSKDAPALFHSSPIINMSAFGNYIFTDLQSLVLFACFCTNHGTDLQRFARNAMRKAQMSVAQPHAQVTQNAP